MRGAFEDEEIVQAKPQRDTEVTLGMGMLVLLVLGLVLVCGVCFGFGYAVGHRTAQASNAAGEPQAAAPAAQANGVAKPSAAAQPAPAPQAQSAPEPIDGAQPAASATQSAPAVVVPVAAASTPAVSTPAAAVNQPMVRPALPAAASSPYVVSASTAHQAIAAAGQLMVQIAAVSHQEDADVLTGALRRHGYAVSAHRDPVDNLIHVRIGPFNNRDEANRWRMKLLDDGYNAMIQP